MSTEVAVQAAWTESVKRDASIDIALHKLTETETDYKTFVAEGIKQLRAQKKSLLKMMNEKFGVEVSLEGHLLKCPLGVTYFYDFLKEEFNTENMDAFYETKSLIDYIGVFNKKRESVVGKLSTSSTSPTVLSASSSEDEEEALRAASSQSLEEVTKYASDVVHRAKQIIAQFIATDSPNQVNIPGAVQERILKAFNNAFAAYDNATACSTKEPESTAKALLFSSLQKVEVAANELVQELLVNMTDPSARFVESDLFAELIVIIMTDGKYNYLKQREKLMRATTESEMSALNDYQFYGGKSRHPVTVAQDLLKMLLQVIESFRGLLFREVADHPFTLSVNEDTIFGVRNVVKEWEVFKEFTGELKNVDLSALKSEEDKVSFWVNVYNVLLVHAALLANGIPTKTTNRNQFMGKSRYNIGGMLFSLYDIEQGILRNNSKSLIYGRVFKNSDPRIHHVVKLPPAALAFALADLSNHSTNIRVIEPSNIYDQLEKLTQDYIKKHVKVNHDTKSIQVPAYMKEHAKEYIQDYCSLRSGDKIATFVASKQKETSSACFSKIQSNYKVSFTMPDKERNYYDSLLPESALSPSSFFVGTYTGTCTGSEASAQVPSKRSSFLKKLQALKPKKEKSEKKQKSKMCSVSKKWKNAPACKVM